MSFTKLTIVFKLVYFTLITYTLLVPSVQLYAETKPKWEVGAGGVAAQSPHYFGSNHYYQGILPYPLLSYRTNRFAAQSADPDRYGQLFVFRKKTLLLEFDFSARFPVESEKLNANPPKGVNNPKAQIVQEKNYTRRGMPNLPLVGFLGAKLSWQPIQYLLIELPALKGFTIGGGFRHVGNIVSPSLEIRFLGKQKENALNITTILTHGDKDYNQFYYGVRKRDVLIDRSEYSPESGLVAITYGPTFTWTLQKNLTLVGGYVFHDLNESVIKDSPLVISPISNSFGIAVNYTFAASDQLVEVW